MPFMAVLRAFVAAGSRATAGVQDATAIAHNQGAPSLNAFCRNDVTFECLQVRGFADPTAHSAWSRGAARQCFSNPRTSAANSNPPT
ncbi:hypothetical protein [Comamonas sp. JC664]|uniref:hypothetical protein n=1 Tax=Comamonas sp. JC664 TaxID=2801917 RepID=UPI001E46640C|nr:hypothetical protein [Comamonas sp. JC664]